MLPLMMLIMNSRIKCTDYLYRRTQHDAGNMRRRVNDGIVLTNMRCRLSCSLMMITMIVYYVAPCRCGYQSYPGSPGYTHFLLKILKTVAKPEEKEKGTEVFDHVSFAYPGAEEEVLSDITLKQGKEKPCAFIGSTGSGTKYSGESIQGFFDVTKGSVRVDGVDIRQMKLADLRERIGYYRKKVLLRAPSSP